MVVIGDSFVVAREVPFDKTPSQLLERYLNESNPGGLSIKQKYEVLNFGTTGFGIPQSLLTNRIYVKDFAPEYVFLFISVIKYPGARLFTRIPYLPQSLAKDFVSILRPPFDAM